MEVSTAFADPVLLTDQWLSSRRPRASDPERENSALLALADEMAQRPDNVLNLLCGLILECCDADSAGVSLLREDTDEFVWPAVAGAWAPFVHGTMPRSASPCGKVVQHDTVLIFRDVVAQFPAAAQASPGIEEIMLAPFHRDGVPVGTVWAISHNPKREFDSEDRRILTNLARFAAAAHQTISARESARLAEKQVSLANRELGHRLKNMLSMVMAITGQTLRNHEDRSAVDALQHRLEALAAAQELLVEQHLSAASVRAVGENVLGAIGQLDRIEMDGPELKLGPRTTRACALVLHELGTNALKYGALSTHAGRVRLSWSRGEGAHPRMTICWVETGGPAVSRPERPGFGTRLIEMGLVGPGGTSIDYNPEGLQVEISADLDEASSL